MPAKTRLHNFWAIHISWLSNFHHQTMQWFITMQKYSVYYISHTSYTTNKATTSAQAGHIEAYYRV